MRLKFIPFLFPLLFLLTGFGWDSLGGYTSITGANQCSTLKEGKLVMDCQSAAWVGKQYDYHRLIVMLGTVYVEGGTNNLAHFTIFGSDDPQGAHYSGMYISYQNGVDKVYVLGGGYSELVATVPHRVHNAFILWDGEKYWHMLDGQLLKVWRYGALQENGSVWLGCSSVNPGQGNDGSRAHCEFGPVIALGF